MPQNQKSTKATSSRLSDYVKLTKPGIIKANVMTAVAGFLFASGGDIAFTTLIYSALGIGFVIAGSCVLNNIMDIEIDSKMKRTKDRALVTGAIDVRNAIFFAGILLVSGLAILYFTTNLLTLILGVVAAFWYVVIYGFSKRRTQHSTLIGTVPGALPLVAGYTAISDRLDLIALTLFLTMVAWQMPHFYAIAIYRKDEYLEAKLPILSIKKGLSRTKYEIVLYTFLFLIFSASMSAITETGIIYLVGICLLSILWLRVELMRYGDDQPVKWAKKVFGASLIVLVGYSLLLSLDYVLP